MFEFIQDIGNYEQRKVAQDRLQQGGIDWGYISTARVSDGRKPFETGVLHRRYGDGEMVIVEDYDTKEQAQEGHRKWLATMTAEQLPEELVDCMGSGIAQLMEAMSGEKVTKRLKV